MTHRSQRAGILLLAGALVLSGCYGPFNLTRRLYRWNGDIQGKWEKEFVFLVLAYVPVYGLAVTADALIFNSMEFWTGNNPVDPPQRRSDLPRTTRIVRGEDEARLTYARTRESPELIVQQFHQGRPAGTLRIRREGGITVGSDADGQVLLMAQALPDGGVVVNDARGKPVASYSAAQVEQFLKSSPQ